MDFFVILMIAVGIFAAAAASNARTAAAWGAASRVLGVTFAKNNAFSNPRLSGSVEGFDLDVSVKSSGNAKVTRYVVSYPPLGIDLHIARKGGLAKITELFGGGGEEETDDPFEQLVSIKASDPQQLPLLLTPHARDAIADLLTNLPAAKVKDDRITFERRNVERQVNTIVATSRRLVATAQAITGRRGAEEPKERAPLPPDPYAPTESMESMPPLPSAPPAPTPSPPTPPPPSDMASSDMASSDMASTLDTTLPSYEMTPSSLDPGSEPLMPSYDEPATPPMAAEIPAPPQPAGGLDFATIAGELFGGNMLSFEAATTFGEQYSGRKIRWMGTVTGHTDTLVRVEVGTIQTTLFGPIQVGAIVETGSPVVEGDQVVVEGTLSSVDTLERTFTVDGTVKRA
jgi:hypothetical protein